jgi:hypothetical protein
MAWCCVPAPAPPTPPATCSGCASGATPQALWGPAFGRPAWPLGCLGDKAAEQGTRAAALEPQHAALWWQPWRCVLTRTVTMPVPASRLGAIHHWTAGLHTPLAVAVAVACVLRVLLATPSNGVQSLILAISSTLSAAVKLTESTAPSQPCNAMGAQVAVIVSHSAHCRCHQLRAGGRPPGEKQSHPSAPPLAHLAALL